MSILDTIIKAPIDAMGRAVVRRLNTPMGVVSAATTGAITGIFVADSVAKDGFLSKNGGLAIGLNVVSGAAMLGIGAAYHKPYLTTMGQVTLGATLVGAVVGGLGYGGSVMPDIHLDVGFSPGKDH
jgi:hypothetical protein